MRGLAFWFFFTAIIYVIAGMAFGIHMSVVQDFALAPAHAHLNLLGWVTMALFGIYYHLVPKAAQGLLARIHFVVATLALWIFIPGIVFAIRQEGELFAKVGSLLTILSMILFLVIVFLSRDRQDASA
ncbi:hypothetical protein [Roseibium aggregatum]|uniref:Cytochrome-c oxidase n=1 Tax=Roseibium aggregatum TaxID=187304 RepID=A0A926S6N4_9HYPH|nr:hypothetical protein [Roseibium aggregatum]MBD1547746.1 hypothetical protein [Roseibium aggregatum]